MRKKYTCRDVIQDLENQILSRKLATGVLLGTSRDLAKRYDVSLRTMERVMAHLTRRGLISRRQGCGTYVQSSVAFSEKPRVCLVFNEHGKPLDLPKLNQLAFGNLEERLREALAASGYTLDNIVLPCELNEEDNILLHQSLDKYDIFISPAWDFYFSKDFFRDCGVEKILIAGDVSVPGPWHQVVYDYRPGFIKAIRLFQKLGQNKIVVVGIADNQTSQARMGIFREEGIRLGYSPDDLLMHQEEENKLSTLLDGQNFVDYYLQNHLENFAIFSTSDYLSIGMMIEFRKRGLKPGRDFQMISYDNFEGQIDDLDFRFGITGITHPQMKIPDVVRTMLDDLHRQTRPEKFYRTYWVPADELVIRQTTGFHI